jgi:hypothetical protein
MAGMMSWLLFRRWIFVIALITLWQSRALSGQPTQTGRINGRVVDIVGATIKGASIFVRKTTPSDSDVKLLTHTNIKGDFTLELPDGGYDILVTSPGFAASVETVAIVHGKPSKFQWKLKPLNCSFPGMNCDAFQ